MHTLSEDMGELRRLLEQGSLRHAYRGLMSYMQSLRMHCKTQRLAVSAVSALYQGFMDMTYFALFPPALEPHGLKIAIVFDWDDFRFEAWLAARNREIQRRYWELCKERPWPGYRLVTPAKGVDSILECDLAPDFDLDDPETLTSAIETTTVAFIAEIEGFLSAHRALSARD